MLTTSSHKTATPSTRNVGNGFFLMFVCMFVNVYTVNRMNVWSQTAIDFDMKLKIQFVSFEHYKILLLHSLRRSTNFFHHPLPSNAFFMENGSPIGLLKNPWQHLSHGLIEWKNRPQKAITCNKTPSYFTGGGGSCHSHAEPSNIRDVSMEIWFRGEWERERKNAYPQLPSSINFSIYNCVGNGKAICFPPCVRWFFSINLSLSINTFYWFSLVSRIRKTYSLFSALIL